jgi:hypothetical protein
MISTQPANQTQESTEQSQEQEYYTYPAPDFDASQESPLTEYSRLYPFILGRYKREWEKKGDPNAPWLLLTPDEWYLLAHKDTLYTEAEIDRIQYHVMTVVEHSGNDDEDPCWNMRQICSTMVMLQLTAFGIASGAGAIREDLRKPVGYEPAEFVNTEEEEESDIWKPDLENKDGNEDEEEGEEPSFSRQPRRRKRRDTSKPVLIFSVLTDLLKNSAKGLVDGFVAISSRKSNSEKGEGGLLSYQRENFPEWIERRMVYENPATVADVRDYLLPYLGIFDNFQKRKTYSTKKGEARYCSPKFLEGYNWQYAVVVYQALETIAHFKYKTWFPNDTRDFYESLPKHKNAFIYNCFNEMYHSHQLTYGYFYKSSAYQYPNPGDSSSSSETTSNPAQDNTAESTDTTQPHSDQYTEASDKPQSGNDKHDPFDTKADSQQPPKPPSEVNEPQVPETPHEKKVAQKPIPKSERNKPPTQPNPKPQKKSVKTTDPQVDTQDNQDTQQNVAAFVNTSQESSFAKQYKNTQQDILLEKKCLELQERLEDWKYGKMEYLRDKDDRHPWSHVHRNIVASLQDICKTEDGDCYIPNPYAFRLRLRGIASNAKDKDGNDREGFDNRIFSKCFERVTWINSQISNLLSKCSMSASGKYLNAKAQELAELQDKLALWLRAAISGFEALEIRI